jgi:hypothetical protein
VRLRAGKPPIKRCLDFLEFRTNPVEFGAWCLIEEFFVGGVKL